MTDRAVLARRWRRFTQLVAVVLVVVVAVGVWPRDDEESSSRAVTNAGETTSTSGAGTTGATPPPDTQPLAPYPGMPAVVDAKNIYSEIGPEHLSPSHAADPARVYVPNGRSNTVSVIDPVSREVIAGFNTSGEPQHVVPSYDLATLWVLDNQGNDLIPIDPATGQPGDAIPVEDPYNMYFTPDGASAIIVAEAKRRLDFRDPHTMELTSSLSVPDCAGMNHADYSADGSYLLVTCEFAGKIAKIDVANQAVLAMLDLTADPVSGQPAPSPKSMPDGSVSSSMPQDIRAAPDGHSFYVADMMAGGVFKVDGDALTVTKFIETGPGAHGITPNRHGTQMYIANRGTDDIDGVAGGPGSVSVLALATDAVTANWPVPDGGSPDMGNLNEDGTELWLSGRFDSAVYVFDTINGGLAATIQVGDGPHGLTFWPQPGRYSLGHTGNMR
jgi:YVTN family beta-propeller protein